MQMAATVSAIKKAMPARGLASMIDEAGNLHEQQNAYGNAYEKLRGEIAMRMKLDGGKERLDISGDEYEAKHAYPDVKHITPEDLFKYDKKLFWGLIRVNLGDAEKVIPGPDYHKLLKVEEAVAPKLTISKIKKKN